MKKWLICTALLLAIVCAICMTALPTEVRAATYGDLTYEINNGEVTITDCNDGLSGELVIPDTIEGYPVTGIGQHAFSGCTGMTNVSIPDGVESIGEGAFQNCSGLISVVIPDSVESIGDSVFWGCRGMTSVKISNNVTRIGIRAFLGCTSLESVTIPDSVETIDWFAFESCYALTDVVLSRNLTTIGYDAFWNCTGLTNITIPDSVTKIETGAFYGCTGLTGVNISDIAKWTGITFGDQKANPLYFAGNLYLNGELVTDLVIPNGVTSINTYAFYGNTALTSVVIPASVESIGKAAFAGCSKLESMTLPFVGGSAAENTFLGYIFGADGWSFNSNNVPASLKTVTIAEGCTDIDNNAFYGCYALTNVELANSVKTIGHYAFQDCRGLTEITIADGVTEIGADAFRGCTGLSQVTFGQSVSRIGSGAFKNCTGLKTVTIPEGLTYIGEAAFEKCTALTKVNISDVDAWAKIQFVSDTASPLFYAKKLYLDGELVTGVILSDACTKIGDYAFRNCTSLAGIAIPDSVTSIGRDAFCGCTGLTNITIPESIETVGRDAFYNCSGLTGVYISDMDAWVRISFATYTANPLYFAKNLYLNMEQITGELQLDNCESIGAYAFAGCDDLTGVVLPEEMVSIGEGAFFDCTGLTGIVIPKGVTSVANDTFNGCTSLTGVVFPEGVTAIGSYAFSRCTSLNTIVIPDGVTSIGERTFYNCSELTLITIPVEMKTVGQYAFYGCQSLWHVLYKGNGLQWGKISVAAQNTPLQNAKRHFLCNGDEAPYPDKKICRLCCTHNYVNRICTICGLIDWPPSGSCGDGLTWILTEDYVLTISGTGAMTDYEAGTAPWYICRGYIRELVIESGVTTIGKNAFVDLTDITAISIPDGVTAIGQCAFTDCEALEKVIFMGDAPSIGDGAITNATCYYDSDNSTWTVEAMQQLGDTVTWIPMSKVLEGGNSVIEQGKEENTAIRVDGEIDDFVGVTINGETVDPSNYTVTEGSTIITFRPEFLKTLKPGSYTVAIIFEETFALTNLTIEFVAKIGDADGDGFVDAFDASQVMKYSVGAISADELNVSMLDVDGDGFVDAFDASLIQKYSVGAIDKFPIEE